MAGRPARPTVDGEQVDRARATERVPGYRAGPIVVRITVWFFPLGRT